MTDFEKLFHTNQPLVYRYLRKLCKDPGLAEELTQETFFRAYINMPQLRRVECVAVWLCQIAKNAYFSWYNAQKRTVPLETVQQLASPDQTETAYLQKELTREALQALDALEEPYKQVLILSIYGETPLKDISLLYGKSESWARVTFHRGKQKLLERIKDYGT